MNTFLKSTAVRVFPTAYRKSVTTTDTNGVSTSTTYNPEAKLNTEFNLTTLVSRITDRDSFVIDYNQTDKKMTISIHGYWFELQLSDAITEGSPLWATISIKDNAPSATASDNTSFSIPTLYSMKDGATVLENLDDASGDFYGIALDTAEPTAADGRYSLQLLGADGEVPESSYLKLSSKSISNGETDDNIAANFSTDAANITTATIGIANIKTDNVETAEIKTANIETDNVGTAEIKTANITDKLTYSGIDVASGDGTHYMWASAAGGVPCKCENIKYVPSADRLTVNNVTVTDTLRMAASSGVNNISVTPSSITVTSLSNITSITTSGISLSGGASLEVYSGTSPNTPTAKITSEGAITAASVSASGTITANSFNATSDARLKENIIPAKRAEGLLDLPICEFDYKETGAHSLGCIAQELREIAPNLVDEDENGFLSVKESKLVYYLLLEVRALRDELEMLKKGR